MIDELNQCHPDINDIEVLKKATWRIICLYVSFGTQFSTQTILRIATSMWRGILSAEYFLTIIWSLKIFYSNF